MLRRGHFLHFLSLPLEFTLTLPLAPTTRIAIYTGGLDETVNESVIHAAFLPFGDIKDVNLPLDQSTQQNRGFGFVTFNEK